MITLACAKGHEYSVDLALMDPKCIGIIAFCPLELDGVNYCGASITWKRKGQGLSPTRRYGSKQPIMVQHMFGADHVPDPARLLVGNKEIGPDGEVNL